MQEENQFSLIIDDLVEKGWSISRDFIPIDLIHRIRNEQIALLEAGEFRQAGVGKGTDFKVRTEIRSDQVLWLNEDEISPEVGIYWKKVMDLKSHINADLYLGLKAFECHFATYPPGSFYKRHLDQFQAVSYRKLSCILYLNEEWQETYGGQLRIFTNENFTEHVDIFPEGGVFACFLSDKIYHEVLPTTKQRYSLTGWLRDKEIGVF